MDNPTEVRPPIAEKLDVWERLPAPLKKYRHILWAVFTAIGLFIFFVVLPVSVRDRLFQAIAAQQFIMSLVAVFGLVSISLFWVVGDRIDSWVFTHVNLTGHRPPWLDAVMLTLTQLGNSFFAFGLAIFLFLISQRRIAYEIMLGTLTAWLIVELVKATVRRPRPFETIMNTRIVGYRESGRSYPSGHTTQVFFLVTMLAQYYHLGGWGAIVLYAVALSVAVTRMYVGAHYPRDVLAGGILGSVLGLVGILIDQRFFVSSG